MVEIILSVAAKVAEYLVDPIGRQFSYLCNHGSHFEELKNEVEKLKVAKNRVQHKVDDAKNKVEEIEENVEKWQESTEKMIDEAMQFIEEEDKAKSRCFKGLNLNLITRYKHSRVASKKVKAVAQLVQEEGTFSAVSRRIILDDVWLVSDKGYEGFESRISTVKDILNALNDVNIGMIGVYGMGGVGKTTLVKEVGRQVKKDKLFDKVVFSEVTDSPDIKRIQKEIADKLGLEFNNETERASKLYARLKNDDKKILIILDNIWEDLDLESVGIPSETDDAGCKLLLTARDLTVLERMGSNHNFKIGALNEEEAWVLFKKKIAGGFIEKGELKSLATEVCKKCGGLPIAIVTLAKALRNKRNTYQWKEALRQLKRPSPANFTGDLKMAYSTIELSYRYLNGKELMKTFLLCSLMEYEASILDLLKCAMGLSIFQGIYTMEELRDKVEASIHELKDCCLLLDGHTNESFSLHDFVREVAISIANRDEEVFNFRNESNWQWPDKAALNTCTGIFMRDSTISELPEGLECPQLESFYMDNNDCESLVKIPDEFFARMRKLKVLKFSTMQLLPLPSSLHLLENLQTLCLDYSKLEDISVFGELKELKILSLRGSNVKQLPREIGQLTRLRLLDLSFCQQLKVIASNVLSNLCQLEELFMSRCSVLWEVEGHDAERRNAKLDELKNLPQLTLLEIDIENDKIFPKGLFSKKLDRYKISIGNGSSEFGGWIIRDSTKSRGVTNFFGEMFIDSYGLNEHVNLRTLKMKLNSTIHLEDLLGFKNVEFLCLDKLQGVENVLYELDKDGFSELKHLRVHNNSDLLCIVDSTKCVPHDAFIAFPILESLILFNLINMETICCGQPTTGSFASLKIIEVKSCVKLKNIFLLSNVARSVPQLQRIRVEDCKNMEEIFAIQKEDNVNNIDELIDEIKFCQLRFLTLNNLPRLASFCSKIKTPSTILQDEHDTLMALFNEKLVFPNLEDLKLFGVSLEKIWNSKLPTMSSCYQNLTCLIISGCGKLKYAFPSSLVQSFKQLQFLGIAYCRVLKEIVAKGSGEEATTLFIFPRVTYLRLENLPELTSFYPGIHTSEWPMLKTLEICSCDKVKVFTSEDNEGQLDISISQSLFLAEKINPNLEELALSRIDNMLTLQGQFPNIFCKLKLLLITKDTSTDISSGILQRCNNLKKLKIDSSSYKEIFSHEENEKDTKKQDSKSNVILQTLEVLEVSRCGKLINVMPSSVSFQNLTVLRVVFCNGLVNLIASSAARSLMQLTEMKIEYCHMMIEVVENEGDAMEDEIVFNKLKLLSLSNLRSLICFYSGNCTLKFPSLEELIVENCPNMKTFSGGDLNTPRLRKVQQNGWNEDAGCWEGELNPTIQQLNKSG